MIKGWRDAWGMPEMPFYFTQMQPYGSPDPNNVGFADIRQVQHLFFINNRKNVGMVIQSDINSANPGGIHYYNKLHPGMRMARWALHFSRVASFCWDFSPARCLRCAVRTQPHPQADKTSHESFTQRRRYASACGLTRRRCDSTLALARN